MRAARGDYGVRASPDSDRCRRQLVGRRPQRGRLELGDHNHDNDHVGRDSDRRPPLLGSFSHHRPLADPGGAAVAHPVHAGWARPVQRDGLAHPGLRAHPSRRHPPPAAAGRCSGPGRRARLFPPLRPPSPPTGIPFTPGAGRAGGPGRALSGLFSPGPSRSGAGGRGGEAPSVLAVGRAGERAAAQNGGGAWCGPA